MDKDEQNAYNEPMKPNSPRHKQLMKVRANLMAVLSETKIPFVMFESDAIWLQNPMEFFAKQQTVLDDANVILSLNSIKGQQRLGANLIIAFANNGTRRLLQELRRQLNQDENLLDQEVIINQLCHSQFGGRFVPTIFFIGYFGWHLASAERRRTISTAMAFDCAQQFLYAN
ncbi:hypothetical protein GPALN_013131 [Globodera pallida]|nr:hypothetical protein GPALN_013131 [Globodera pallida]